MPVRGAGWPKLSRQSEQELMTMLRARFDAKTMVENPKVAASSGMVDDGTGVKEVRMAWPPQGPGVPGGDVRPGVRAGGGPRHLLLRRLLRRPVRLQVSRGGHLVTLLSDGRKDCYLIYYWLGAHSSQDEQVQCGLGPIAKKISSVTETSTTS